MAVVDKILYEVVNMAIRAESSSSTLATTTLSSHPTTTLSSMSNPQTSQPSGTNDSNKNQDNSATSNSPLLFFVALGFGVVFTNLWIIVGVKYCFRYNARNRARMLNEDGEPVQLENMPRPHRRRREKKLMTIDEVNEKFPMMKYKTWVSQRAREGLPTAGGVSVPASRANSLRDAAGIATDLSAKERSSTEDTTQHTDDTSKIVKELTDDVSKEKGDHKATDMSGENGEPSKSLERPSTQMQRVASADDEDDDEQINAALPPELLAAPGDTCAICIDTLEDDEDVRGLACGHAFHAVCVDPWLTSRRACCPLCKADYYVPKPRPNAEGENANTNNESMDPLNSRLNLPAGLGAVWYRGLASSRPSNFRRNQPRRNGESSTTQQANTSEPNTNQVSEAETSPGVFSSVRNAFAFGRRRNGENETSDAAGSSSGNAQETVTPSQLESGTQRNATTAQ